MSPNANVPSIPQDCAQLTYDIPSGKMPNPSHLLASRGLFRINYSVWVGTTAAIALLPLEKWSAVGAVVTVMEYKEKEWEKVRAACERALIAETQRFREFMEKQVALATETFAKAEAEQSAKLTGKARGILRGALNDGRRRVNAARASLLMFDLLNTREDLLKAMTDEQDAYMAAHETAAWLKQRKAGAPQEAIEFAALTDVPVIEPEPAIEDALDFLSGVTHEKVNL